MWCHRMAASLQVDPILMKIQTLIIGKNSFCWIDPCKFYRLSLFFWISSTLLLCVRRYLSFACWFWPLRAALGPAGMQMSPDKGDGEAKRSGSRELELLLVICRAIKQCPKNVPLSFLFPPLPLFFTALEQHLLHIWWAGGAVRALEYKIFFFARPLENPRPSQNNSLQPTV